MRHMISAVNGLIVPCAEKWVLGNKKKPSAKLGFCANLAQHLEVLGVTFQRNNKEGTNTPLVQPVGIANDFCASKIQFKNVVLVVGFVYFFEMPLNNLSVGEVEFKFRVATVDVFQQWFKVVSFFFCHGAFSLLFANIIQNLARLVNSKQTFLANKNALRKRVMFFANAKVMLFA